MYRISIIQLDVLIILLCYEILQYSLTQYKIASLLIVHFKSGMLVLYWYFHLLTIFVIKTSLPI